MNPDTATVATHGSSTSPLPCLRTRRLLLRAIAGHDLAAFYALYSDTRVMRYWSFPAWTSIDQARDYFESAMSGCDPTARLCWAITRLDEDVLVGNVTLFSIDARQGRAEIGYALHPAHWGRGYAAEALDAVLAHAFDTLALRRVEADIDPRNAASCRLAERVGFKREGLLRERWHVAGELCDTALYGLLARDWRAPGTRPGHAATAAP